jgi:hypothetical protein
MTLAASRAWEKADLLWSAVEKYSPAELWNRFVELGAASQETSWPSYFITPPLRDGATPRSGSPLGVIEERQILLNEIRAAFIHMLTESKLSGVGYKLPRRRGDKPEWISSEYWKAGRIDWDRSELHCAHCSYQDVRIVPSREIRDEACRPFRASVKESGHLERGRPTRESHIIHAWNVLVAEGKIPRVGPLNSIFDLVRDKVHEMFDSEKPDHEGLGEKVLYRVLGPLFKAYRHANSKIP